MLIKSHTTDAGQRMTLSLETTPNGDKQYVMSGGNWGEHSLSADPAITTDDRLENHWVGYVGQTDPDAPKDRPLTMARVAAALTFQRAASRVHARKVCGRGGLLRDRGRDLRTANLMEQGGEPWYLDGRGLTRKLIEEFAAATNYEPIFIEGGFDWYEAPLDDWCEPGVDYYSITIVPVAGRPFKEWTID